uniref:Uncharacterized protein AlNc14C259G9777 n=1 Tax=Albugo laibachii Nc14 TaxID=890382 RepID=F0WTV2_9STRA|nr:conserved hypothetical protein [Albugo laibachii Nc14]|eukprot:CCA24796.1 conserved hypothetical protein [Albugo laibachii Nc14]
MQRTLDKSYGHLKPDKRDQETKRKSIYTWAKQRTHIEDMCRVTTGASQKSTQGIGTATVISREEEVAIKLWVNSLRREGIPTSALMLQLKAQSVAEDEGVLSDVLTDVWSLRYLFLKRHGISFRTRTRQGQQTSRDMAAAAEKTCVSVDRVCCELGITKIYNADQSGIFFEYLPKLIMSRKGEKPVWVRCSGKYKQQFTGIFLCDSDGNQYPPFYVLEPPPSKNSDTAERNAKARHGFGVRLWKDIKVLSESSGAQIYANRCGWWNSALSIEFLGYHFAACDSEEPVLLLWGDYSAHWTEEVRTAHRGPRRVSSQGPSGVNVGLSGSRRRLVRAPEAQVSWQVGPACS